MMPSKLTEKHKNLADKLISLHIEESPYTLMPAYEYEQLRKGINCKDCSSFSITTHGRYFVCRECGKDEQLTVAVLRSAREYMLLFLKGK